MGALSGQGEEIDALIIHALGECAHSTHRHAGTARGASSASRSSWRAGAYDTARELQWAGA
eukprot:7384561-Prymnesium_polylepis.1